MKLIWLGHSCFKVVTSVGTAVIDAFQDGSVPGIANIRETADVLLSSHEHGDHYAPECVTLTGNTPGFKVSTVECFHDDEGGAKRGKNIIHIIEADGVRVAHFGDIGHMLSNEQFAQLGKLDAVMIPVGGTFTVDAGTAMKIALRTEANVIIPMHYKSDKFGFGVLDTVNEFVARSLHIKTYPAEIAIVPNMEKQTALLYYGI